MHTPHLPQVLILYLLCILLTLELVLCSISLICMLRQIEIYTVIPFQVLTQSRKNAVNGFT